MARQSAFLNYKGIKIYRGLTGNSELTFWYSRIQNNQVEGGYELFDIRLLPKKYRRGLDIDPDFSGARAAPSAGYMYDRVSFQRISDLQADAHRDVLRRAIDDEYDLDSAGRGNYGQFFRRLRRWLRMKSGRLQGGS
jgi:hypothetical protein